MSDINIIHLFWDSMSGFYNNGTLCLWIETPNVKAFKTHYRYQANKTELILLAESWFKNHIASYDIKEVILQANIQGKAVPSPIIANLSGLDDDVTITQSMPWILHIIRIKEPLSFLKNLNFQQNYFTENI